jgi:hypothetical protein
MRNHDVAGKSTVLHHADRPGAAHVFIAPCAKVTILLSATYPRIDHATPANGEIAGIVSEGNDLANDFVARRERKPLLAPPDGRPSAVAKIEITVGNVEIAMAYAASGDLDEHLRPANGWKLLALKLQWGTEFANPVATPLGRGFIVHFGCHNGFEQGGAGVQFACIKSRWISSLRTSFVPS